MTYHTVPLSIALYSASRGAARSLRQDSGLDLDAASFEDIQNKFWGGSGRTASSAKRESYWRTRSQKLQERLALEQEIYNERQRQRAIDEEIHAEHRQQEQINERAALSELGVEPGTIGLSPVPPILRGTPALLSRGASV